MPPTDTDDLHIATDGGSTTERIHAFITEASPPLVKTPILFMVAV